MKYDNSNNFYQIAFADNTNKVAVHISKDGIVYQSGNLYAVNNNVWTHLVMIFNSGEIKIYINGIDKSGGSGIGQQINTTDANLFIGKKPQDSPPLCLIDDVRIYNRALSAAEIQAIYNATK